MKTVKHMIDGKIHKVLSIGPQRSVLEALEIMREYDIGALMVISHRRVIGIFSERDYARKIILSGKRSRETLVSDIMTSSVTTVNLENTVNECMELMTRKRIRHLPVVSSEKPVGMVSIGDVVKEMISEQKFIIKQLEQYITG